MLEALKNHWQDLSDNFYENYLKIKLWLLTIQYVAATGDMETWENMYGYKG
jgi:hypothetical protein